MITDTYYIRDENYVGSYKTYSVSEMSSATLSRAVVKVIRSLTVYRCGLQVTTCSLRI